jgi:hypothetical protein
MKRLTLAISVVSVIAMPCVWYFAYDAATPNSMINRAHFERIQIGMTEADVEKIFQCKSGLYNRLPCMDYIGPHGNWGEKPWISDDAVILITFSRRGNLDYSPEGNLDVRDDGTPWRVVHKFHTAPTRLSKWDEQRLHSYLR